MPPPNPATTWDPRPPSENALSAGTPGSCSDDVLQPVSHRNKDENSKKKEKKKALCMFCYMMTAGEGFGCILERKARSLTMMAM